MKRDIIYIFIISFLAITVLSFNEELKRNYEKGYDTRQAEITNYIEGLEDSCKSRSIDKRHYYVVISERILNDKRTVNNSLPGISYHCTYIDYLESTPELKN